MRYKHCSTGKWENVIWLDEIKIKLAVRDKEAELRYTTKI